MDVAVFTGVTVLMDFLILLSRALEDGGGVALIALPEMIPGAEVLRSCEGISGSVVSVMLMPHDGCRRMNG
jgi:hypothetical protein